MYFDRYLGSHAMLCRHFFSKCHVIKISKIFGDFVSLCQGLLPTSRHFEHRQGEGPGDEVATAGQVFALCLPLPCCSVFHASAYWRRKIIFLRTNVVRKTEREFSHSLSTRDFLIDGLLMNQGKILVSV